MTADTDRAALAARVRTVLEAHCPGSRTKLTGSLAAGTADAFSDIDLAWIVPDAHFPDCLTHVAHALGQAQRVDSIRSDPDFLHSERRRLLFVRFAEVPLFWRLDLDVRAASVADDPHHDTDHPAARARDDEWSRPASALANAIGAVKAAARRQDDRARGLLDRGFARIGVADRATGAWTQDAARLAHAAALQEPSLTTLAEQVTHLATCLETPTRTGTAATQPPPARYRRS
jgi:hypothetical protein